MVTRGCLFVSRHSILLHSKENDLTWARMNPLLANFVFGIKKHLPGPVFLETKHEREVIGGKFSLYGTIYS